MVGNVAADTKRVPHRPRILLALPFALFSACALSQTQLATIFGTVSDPSSAVIPGVAVTIVNQSTGLKREVATRSTGEYRFTGLPIGTYALHAEKEGFQPQVREGIALTSASEAMVNLSLALGGRREQVTVVANVSTIDNTTSTIGGLIAERSLAELPLNGRDLFSAAILEPGVSPTPSSAPSLLSSGKVGQVAINGMRSSWTNVLIDGMDANDPVFGFSPAGASGLFLGLNELAEVRVLTHTYSAEYGGNGGGVIEAVTKSGSNHFHGSLYELHRDASLNAKNTLIWVPVRFRHLCATSSALVSEDRWCMIAPFSLRTMRGFARYRHPQRLPLCRVRSPMKVCSPLPRIPAAAPAPLRAGALP